MTKCATGWQKIHVTVDDVDVISDSLVKRITAHNCKVIEHCEDRKLPEYCK